MLVDTQKDLSKFFSECSLYADLTMQKFSQKKKIFSQAWSAKLYFKERVFYGNFVDRLSNSWKLPGRLVGFLPHRMVGLLLRCNSSKLREGVWSPTASTAQLMLAELKTGKWSLDSPVSRKSHHCAAIQHMWAARDRGMRLPNECDQCPQPTAHLEELTE